MTKGIKQNDQGGASRAFLRLLLHTQACPLHTCTYIMLTRVYIHYTHTREHTLYPHPFTPERNRKGKEEREEAGRGKGK